MRRDLEDRIDELETEVESWKMAYKSLLRQTGIFACAFNLATADKFSKEFPNVPAENVDEYRLIYLDEAEQMIAKGEASWQRSYLS